MRKNFFDPERRSFLIKMIAAGAFVGADLTDFFQNAFAMAASQPIFESLREVQGEVLINGVVATVGTSVSPDDTLITGPKAKAVLVVGKDAFLVREHSHIIFSGKSKNSRPDKRAAEVETLHVRKGGILSVFGRGSKRIETPTAVCGIRGTGIYVEAELDRTYVCTCYGEVEIQALAASEARETVKTKHHEAPRFIYAKGGGDLIQKAPMLNHTDEELVMLEALVYRKPPFAGSPLMGAPGQY